MTTYCKRCVSDEALAAVSLFAIENRRELHPSFGTLDMVSLLCSHITEGHLIYITNSDNRVLGMMTYYHGTPEKQFEDKDIAFVNFAIMARAYRGTRLFVKGLYYMVELIIEAHPDVQELRFNALSENTYLCRLYSKFAIARYTQESNLGEETVFCAKIHQLRASLTRYIKV
ncbi:hypothetical protein PAESOLCIP111_05620 [Paenibacillus solanacearum]|uniref:Uncharacterized protein n=1 Tax=Paenibacillus solanacearum TaxID=2048548 RepID=A0A916K6H1_9BACL|nr:hypothetical protein [Paenibacillus solanacearum]CAG7648547.1 hypothetical protein PAESOLCIP111_05620 [Paenibacillus solanacearum]